MCSQPFSTLFLYVSQNSTPPDVDDRHYQLLFCCFSLIQKRRKVCVRHSFGDKSSSSSATLKFQWCLLRLSVNVGTTHLAASVVLLVPMWKNLMCYRFIANEDWRHHFLKCLSVEHSIMYSTVSSNKNKAFVCPSQPLLCRSKIQTDGLLATAIQVHPHRQDLAIRSQRPILLAKEKKRESPKKKSGINFKNSGAQHQIHFRRAPNLDGSPPPPSHQITSHCIHCNSSFHRKRPVPNHGEHHRRMPPDAE